MCLRMLVWLPDQASVDERLAEQIVPPGTGLGISLEKSIFSRRSTTLRISEQDEGCGCSFLTETADPAADTWDLQPAFLPGLAKLVRNIPRLTQEKFLFTALWEGDEPRRLIEVTLEELAAIIESNHLGTHIQYSVQSGQ